MKSTIEVGIDRWAAWAPGLETQEDWIAWAKGERSFGELDSRPAAAFVKPMVRRRLSRLSRMSLEVAEACRQESEQQFYVFCSRYGEYSRTSEALTGMSRGEPLSPAAFSHSVHNTSAGLFTIIHGDQSPAITVSAGATTLEAGFLEAWTALKTGDHKRALVVYHEEPLSSIYIEPEPVLAVPLAAAFVISLPSDENNVSLSWSSGDGVTPSDLTTEHPVLQVLRLVMKNQSDVRNSDDRLQWNWRRCD